MIIAASFYLYSLSLYLPAGPRRRPLKAADREHVGAESEHPADSSEEPSRFLLLHKRLTHLTRLTFLRHLKKKVCCAPTTPRHRHKLQLFPSTVSQAPFSLNCTISVCKGFSLQTRFIIANSAYSCVCLNGYVSLLSILYTAVSNVTLLSTRMTLFCLFLQVEVSSRPGGAEGAGRAAAVLQDAAHHICAAALL